MCKPCIREFTYWQLAGGVYGVYGGLVIKESKFKSTSEVKCS